MNVRMGEVGVTVAKFRIRSGDQTSSIVRSDITVWRQDRMYAIAFDLDQDALAAHYKGTYPRSAYDELRREFAAHRFQRQQGSLYVGEKGTDSVSCVLVVQALTKKFPWFRPAVRDIRMFRIEENNDLMPAVGQGELPLGKTQAA